MSNYELVVIVKGNLGESEASSYIETVSKSLSDQGVEIKGFEYWGNRKLAYRINKFKKAHYYFYKIASSNIDPINETIRLIKLSDSTLRHLLVKVEEHEEGDSIMMRKENDNA